MGKMIPQPTTHTILNTHPRILHIHTQKQPKPTDFICENKSPVIWKFRGMASFTKMTAVSAKISDNKVVLRNGKQIFLFQIAMFLKRNIPSILGCHSNQNCFIAQVRDNVLKDILKII